MRKALIQAITLRLVSPLLPGEEKAGEVCTDLLTPLNLLINRVLQKTFTFILCGPGVSA
jgi:hypothetical protein